MKFTELAKKLQEGVAPFYLIEGEDGYFRDHAVSNIRAACGITQLLLNDVRIEGETLKGELPAFRDKLYALPFMDEKRLVRVYDFYPTEREWETFLKPYAEKPCPSTVLLFVNGGKKAGGADLRRKREVVYVDCSRADKDTLSRWLFQLMRREGLQPETEAVELMAAYCGLDAARMKQETEKLRFLVGEGGKVTAAVVEENVAKDAEYKIYELAQAASGRNFTAFSEILNDLLVKGFDENAVLSSLVSHFRSLCEISRMRGTDEEIGKIIGMHPYGVKRSRETVRRLGAERTEELYLSLYGLLSGMRAGMYLKTGALSSAIAKIFFG